MRLYLVNVAGSLSARFWEAREIDGDLTSGEIGHAFENAQERGAVFVLAKHHADALTRGRVLQQAKALLDAVRAEAVRSEAGEYRNGYAAALGEMRTFLTLESDSARCETLTERRLGIEAQSQRMIDWISAHLPSTKDGAL